MQEDNGTTPNTSVSTQTSTPKPISGLIMKIGLLILFILLPIAAFYLGITYQKNNTAPNQIVTHNTSLTPSIRPSEEPTQTQVNKVKEKNNISITMAAGWKKEVLSKNNVEIITVTSPDSGTNCQFGICDSTRVVINKDSQKMSYEEFYKQKTDEINTQAKSGPTSTELTKLTIGGYPAISYKDPGDLVNKVIYIWQDNNIWKIVLSSNKESSSFETKYKNDVDQMLNSIQFIE